ncbi:MAG: hypothetical protein E5299_01409 [Burkholderia gladioli]|nr:MAG: hypothetical protein E5299_01409 [Burkholderia gladioli]
MKTVYRLTLRALQGFTQSLRDLSFPSLPVRNDTTLCRRANTLDVELPILRDHEPIHLVVDSTGLKVYGEGEWKVRQHGYLKRRTWRKVHLALNANTGQVHAALMTHQNVMHCDALAKLLDQMPREEHINVIDGDGAYDTKPCHAAIAAWSVLFLRFRHARVPLIGQQIRPVRRGVTARLMELPVTFVENGRKTVATTGDRLPRMRCIGSRRSPATVSGRVTVIRMGVVA